LRIGCSGRYFRDEVTGEWRRLYKEEIYDLHSLPSIILLIKLRRIMRVMGACSSYVRQESYVDGFGEERVHLEELGIDGKIILQWIYQEVGWGSWTGLICLRIGVS
jgi:hypothetical protein